MQIRKTGLNVLACTGRLEHTMPLQCMKPQKKAAMEAAIIRADLMDVETRMAVPREEVKNPV